MVGTFSTCGVDHVDQGRALRLRTSPDPDGAGPLPARTTELVYDAAARVRGQRQGADGWSCTT